MPFEIVETVTKANSPPLATMTYMRSSRTKGGKSQPRLTITIPTTVCGVSKSDYFILMIGNGDDAGKVLLVGERSLLFPKKPSGSQVKVAQLKHAFRWCFGFVPLLGEDIFDGERFPVKRNEDETFEITTPVDFFGVPKQEPKTPEQTPASSTYKKR